MIPAHLEPVRPYQHAGNPPCYCCRACRDAERRLAAERAQQEAETAKGDER